MRELNVRTLATVRPQLEYRDCYAPRNIKTPDGSTIFLVLHHWYWAVLDQLDASYPGVSEDMIEDAWNHAVTLADGHPYDYVYEIFSWTFPFEIRLMQAVMGAIEHNAANDFLDGLYRSMEVWLNDYDWPTPLTYRRIITDPRVRDE